MDKLLLILILLDQRVELVTSLRCWKLCFLFARREKIIGISGSGGINGARRFVSLTEGRQNVAYRAPRTILIISRSGRSRG